MFFSDTDKDGIVEVSQTGGHNELLQQEHYYPFGMGIKGEWKFVQPQIGGTNLYQYNGKELNDDFGLNWNDYGARWYDASIGRWNAVDPLAEKYSYASPYNYVLNNPINAIDPDGRDIIILTWFSEDDKVGHSGIAIENYKKTQKLDGNGNPVFDDQGNSVMEKVHDGTYTYYDIWPNDQVDDVDLQTDVDADYSAGVQIASLSDLLSKDPTGSRSGSVAPEGRPADGVVAIPTSPEQDLAAYIKGGQEARKKIKYNACDNNCATFVQRILNEALRFNNHQIDASQEIRPEGALRAIYSDARTVAPNNLHNEALKVKGAIDVNGTGPVIAKPYLEYFGKRNRP